MTYSLVSNGIDGAVRPGVVRRDADGAFIPADPLNADWRDHEAWRAAGNTPSPAPVFSPPPTVTGNRWALAIGDLGLAGALLAAVAAAKPGDRHRYGLIARDTVLSPDDPLLARICAGSGGRVDLATVFDRALALSR